MDILAQHSAAWNGIAGTSALFIVFTLYAAVIVVLWWGVRRATRSSCTQARPTVSVVIAGRNEAAVIAACLRALEAQTYPHPLWEVVVVDDRSSDGTAEIVRRWQSRLRRLSVVRVDHLPAGKQGKKHALELGIQRAGGQVVLTTDADCQPPPQWIEEVAGRFDAATDAVIGYSPVRSPARRLWARALEVDALAAGVVAAAGVGLGTVITCSGRNLAYRRRLFESNGGFSDLHRSVSGDDDLLLHRLKRRKGAQITFAAAQGAVVPAIAPAEFRSALRQRLRHLSAGRYYPRPVLAGYALFHGCNALLWAAAAAALFGAFPGAAALTSLAAKLVLDGLLLHTFARRMAQSFHIRFLLPWEIYLLLSTLLLSPLAAVARIRWKE